ncbi:DUF1190 domain-containing protein [Albimonas pacifica]|uniref:Uncharacterized conserved protein YgiB, involved in bioifilm formation, UPF0441/DUF1190 family n=1 Tax=Albimonas pacifica TaxID=1114924 RepID=A0A1I3FBR1_9RHOB|nr:DUF1190 domain-containing protein [Albimonas pacifica]SFI08584.1 Uncharacterized conserved protein YgiB, involved in bioifilm formation, UPF0441/DUF1190 family [Albimonas pacifica]
MTQTRKRSRSARAALKGCSGAAFVLALAGCEQEQDLTFFETKEQCYRGAVVSAQLSEADCDEAFAEAVAEHAVAAPRYESLELCEEEHGAGVCGRPEQVGGETDPQHAGVSFMPFMMGYMMGSMLSGGQSHAAGRPLYREARSGGWFTTNGTRTGFSGRPGAVTRGFASTLAAPRTTAIAAPMTRATVTQAGGFGAARSAATGRGFGGFGG